jgi:16S rRNA (guanine527-N7)-methyltransferase
MDSHHIAELLEPFLAARDSAGPGRSPWAERALPLSPLQLDQISIYIDLLLRWNARVNLTAVREPEEIVTRHLGESLFAARHLLPAGPGTGPEDEARSAPAVQTRHPTAARLTVDLGSGAGFPGLPLKIWSPQARVTLIESNQKKVAFLREIIRALTLTDINVFASRAEDFPPASATLLTLRAVERFDAVLPIATGLLAPGAHLALLVGQSQVARARELAPTLSWAAPIPVPQSQSRVLLVAETPAPA